MLSAPPGAASRCPLLAACRARGFSSLSWSHAIIFYAPMYSIPKAPPRAGRRSALVAPSEIDLPLPSASNGWASNARFCSTSADLFH